jgi:hypothetical protein
MATPRDLNQTMSSRDDELVQLRQRRRRDKRSRNANILVLQHFDSRSGKHGPRQEIPAHGNAKSLRALYLYRRGTEPPCGEQV